MMLEEVVDAVPPIRQSWGRSRQRPAKLHADKAYDHRRCRRALTRRRIQPRIARRGIESSAKLGRHRWVVERTLAWFSQFRRLAIRYERRADIHEGCCQTDANSSRFRQVRQVSGGADRPPLGKSGGAVLLEELAAGEASIRVEMVGDGGVDGRECL